MVFRDRRALFLVREICIISIYSMINGEIEKVEYVYYKTQNFKWIQINILKNRIKQTTTIVIFWIEISYVQNDETTQNVWFNLCRTDDATHSIC